MVSHLSGSDSLIVSVLVWVITTSIGGQMQSAEAQSSLNGVWIGAYKTTATSTSSDNSLSRFLLDIQSDTIVFKAFPYPNSGQFGSVDRYPYQQKGNTLIVEKASLADTMDLLTIGNNRLVFAFRGNESVNWTVKRLESNDTATPDLLNHAYAFSRGNQVIDTLEFVSDSMMLFYSEIQDAGNSAQWRLDQYKHYTFLLLDDAYLPPYLIDSVTDSSIYLRLFYTSVINMQLRQVQSAASLDSLFIGWWSLTGRGFTATSLDEDYKKGSYLRVMADTLVLNFNDRAILKKWKFNATNGYLLFPDNELLQTEAWKILELTNSRLLIEYPTNIFHPEETEILEFKR